MIATAMTDPDPNRPAEADEPLESAVRDALRTVVDPEVGVNIVDLGLVYRIELDGRRLRIDLTMTSPACPMSQMVVDDVQAVVDAVVPDDLTIDVALVWEPPWAPEMMNDSAREFLGWQDT